MDKSELFRALTDFVEGRDQSMANAGRIEVAMDEMYGEKEPFASAVLDLASYRPEGGPYLHDAAEMVKILRNVMDVIAEGESD
jgi:hypothetical protein